jgi:hypothetical protein
LRFFVRANIPYPLGRNTHFDLDPLGCPQSLQRQGRTILL